MCTMRQPSEEGGWNEEDVQKDHCHIDFQNVSGTWKRQHIIALSLLFSDEHFPLSSISYSGDALIVELFYNLICCFRCITFETAS